MLRQNKKSVNGGTSYVDMSALARLRAASLTLRLWAPDPTSASLRLRVWCIHFDETASSLTIQIFFVAFGDHLFEPTKHLDIARDRLSMAHSKAAKCVLHLP